MPFEDGTPCFAYDWQEIALQEKDCIAITFLAKQDPEGVRVVHLCFDLNKNQSFTDAAVAWSHSPLRTRHEVLLANAITQDEAQPWN